MIYYQKQALLAIFRSLSDFFFVVLPVLVFLSLIDHLLSIICFPLMPKLIFPKGFFWGASTASHQVEGNNHNDWTKWEKKNANRLAKESEKSFDHNPN